MEVKRGQRAGPCLNRPFLRLAHLDLKLGKVKSFDEGCLPRAVLIGYRNRSAGLPRRKGALVEHRKTRKRGGRIETKNRGLHKRRFPRRTGNKQVPAQHN